MSEEKKDVKQEENKAEVNLDLLSEAKKRLETLHKLSSDLLKKFDDKELADQQKMHLAYFTFAATDCVSAIISFNNLRFSPEEKK